ncbi:MAG: SUMF1/EgtB/PvdO family nonheme iron enzyme [Deltaproteobacteria bacterium]|nr:SUMF1/EgtB/PvdO family nonheme iron enzyme [Deltaproteobacteria bacterium]
MGGTLAGPFVGRELMKQNIQLLLPILLCAAASGCNGCGLSAAIEGSTCEQASDCAEGLWCLGRVCRQAPAQPRHWGGGHDVVADAAHDASIDGAILDAGHDTGIDASLDATTDANDTDVELDGGPDAELDGGDGGADTGIVVQCGPSPTGKGGLMCDVPAGPFMMGCNEVVDDKCSDDEKPYHEVTVPSYKIDKFEVTTGEYKACVDSGVCTVADTGTYCNYSVAGKENHPINCVDWNQATAYCVWAGKRLPTEAEWEKAAGGTDGRKYPWGNTGLDCDHALWCEDGSNYPSSCGCGSVGTLPVGSKPLGGSPYDGALDIVGNVWEWVEDWYHNTYTGAPSDGSAWVAPTGSDRVIRGGSWDDALADSLRASARNDTGPSRRLHSLGFRCAYSVLADLDGGVDAGPDGGLDAGQDAGPDGGVIEGVWIDSTTGLMWQNPASDRTFTYDEAIVYCGDLYLDGHDDWRVPTISELRSLIRGCPDTQTGGACGVTDSCLEDSCRWQGCSGCLLLGGPGEGGCYWDAALRGPCYFYWSSSSYAGATSLAWYVFFFYGNVDYFVKPPTLWVRCVRGP